MMYLCHLSLLTFYLLSSYFWYVEGYGLPTPNPKTDGITGQTNDPPEKKETIKPEDIEEIMRKNLFSYGDNPQSPDSSRRISPAIGTGGRGQKNGSDGEVGDESSRPSPDVTSPTTGGGDQTNERDLEVRDLPYTYRPSPDDSWLHFLIRLLAKSRGRDQRPQLDDKDKISH